MPFYERLPNIGKYRARENGSRSLESCAPADRSKAALPHIAHPGTHQTHTVARRIFNVRGALRLVAEFAGAEQCYAGYEGRTRLIRFEAGLVETPHEAEQRRKSERIAVHWLHMSIA